MPTTPTAIPASWAWQRRPGDDTSHAYSSGPGWMRSVCRAERWTAALQPEDPADVRCTECVDLTTRWGDQQAVPA